MSPVTVSRSAAGVFLFIGLLGLADASLAAGPTTRVTLSASEFQPGQTLTIGIDAQNPDGNAAADFYVGVVLPGGQTAAFFSIPGVIGGIAAVAVPAQFPRMLTAPPGFVLSAPSFFRFTFPITGVAPGTYQVFAALVRQGALQSNRLDPSAILAFDSHPFAFTAPASDAGSTPTSGPRTPPVPGPSNPVLPLFQKPFQGDFTFSNPFDHDLPFEFTDTNGFLLTWWGERTTGIDGHDGWDFRMPEGTPLLAVADGPVIFAGAETPRTCPILDNRMVSGNSVRIQHDAPNGEQFQSSYGHLSRVDIQQGQMVRAGQQIGLSGNTGCTTGPHVHFAVRRVSTTNSGRPTRIDPFGWEGPGPDPWAQHPQGAASVWLWKEGQAPALFREAVLAPNPKPTDNARVAITTLRWMGVRDDQNPNNESVELTLDPRFAPAGVVDMTGYTLRNNRGDVFTFPAGFVIQRDRPVRVFSGSGQNSETALYWGLGRGAWDNMGDCARSVTPSGGTYRLSASARCP